MTAKSPSKGYNKRRTSLSFGQGGGRKQSIIEGPIPIAEITETPYEENEQHSETGSLHNKNGSDFPQNVITVGMVLVDHISQVADVHPPVDLNKTIIHKRKRLAPPSILISPA